MNRFLPLALLLGACVTELPSPSQPCADWEEPGLYTLHIDQDDTKKRKAWIWVPKSTGPRSQVVVLHGAGSNHTRISDVTRFIRLAEDEGFVAIFPDGLGPLIRGWNAGDCCVNSREEKKDIDDVAYLEALAAEVSRRTCGADTLGVGFSAGAMMTHRWACEGTTLDALMPSSGPLMVPECKGEPIAIRHYHGADDPTVPPQGGLGKNESALYTSVDQTMEIWRARNNCTDEEPTVEVDGDVTCTRWSCDVATEMCIVDNWAHMYPGGSNRKSDQHDATTEGWNWFKDVRDITSPSDG